MVIKFDMERALPEVPGIRGHRTTRAFPERQRNVSKAGFPLVKSLEIRLGFEVTREKKV